MGREPELPQRGEIRVKKNALQLVWKPVVVGLLVLVAIDALIFRTDLYFRYLEPQSTAGTIALNYPVFDHDYRQGAKNVLVVGDSRIGEGFSRAAANAIGEKRGVNFIRIGMPGTTPRVWKYFLSSIDRPSQPISAVVLMTSSLRDSEELELGNPNDRLLDVSYMAPLLRLADVPEFVGSFQDRAARIRALRASAFPALAVQSDLHGFLAAPIARIEKARVWSASYPTSLDGYQGRPERIPDVAPSALSAPRFDPAAVSPEIAQSLGDYLRSQRSPRPPTSARNIQEYRKVWYGRIAEEYSARRIPVFVYQIPRGPFHKELVGDRPPEGSLVELARAGKLTLLDAAPFVDLEQPQYFFDFLHLNNVGRQAFSQRLAEIVTPLVP